MNKKLKKEVWEKDKYWAIAEKGSLDREHPGMQLLLKTAKEKNNILDLGCGEGTRLSLINGSGKKLTGIDISATAIKSAKSKKKNIKFVLGNIEKLPFADASFDLVYSAFVFEHLDEPERVLKEAFRVLKPGGGLIIIAPNYGAPNRASPPFSGDRIAKMVKGIVRDFTVSNNLDWQKVNPIADKDTYEIDWDTTIEPYLGTLIRYIHSLGLNVIMSSSSWSEDSKDAGFMQKIFRYLGELGVYPFVYWGPHLVLAATK